MEPFLPREMMSRGNILRLRQVLRLGPRRRLLVLMNTYADVIRSDRTTVIYGFYESFCARVS